MGVLKLNIAITFVNDLGSSQFETLLSQLKSSRTGSEMEFSFFIAARKSQLKKISEKIQNALGSIKVSKYQADDLLNDDKFLCPDDKHLALLNRVLSSLSGTVIPILCLRENFFISKNFLNEIENYVLAKASLISPPAIKVSKQKFLFLSNSIFSCKLPTENELSNIIFRCLHPIELEKVCEGRQIKNSPIDGLMVVSTSKLLISSSCYVPLLVSVPEAWAGEVFQGDAIWKLLEHYSASSGLSYLSNFDAFNFCEVCDMDEWGFKESMPDMSVTKALIAGSDFGGHPHRKALLSRVCEMAITDERFLHFIDLEDPRAIIKDIIGETLNELQITGSQITQQTKRPLPSRKKFILCAWIVYYRHIKTASNEQDAFVEANKYIFEGPKTKIVYGMLVLLAIPIRMLKIHLIIKRLIPSRKRKRLLKETIS